MANVKIQITQPFLRFPPSIARSREEAMEELDRPCGRFLSPFTLKEKFRLFLSRELAKSDPLENVEAILASGVPLNWQVLLRYLHEHGVITEPQFRFSERSNDLPKIYAAELRAQNDESKTDGKSVNKYGYAGSHDAEVAMAKTVGEVLERHYLSLYHRASFLRSSYEETSKRRRPALNILDLNSFLSWQQQRNPRLIRDSKAPIYWATGETLGGKSVYIPAQLIFWNYDFEHDKSEPLLEHTTTNGAGGHFTREEAILSGLLETIERDGFLIYWLNRLSPGVIDVSSITDEALKEFLASVARYGLEIRFLNTTTDVGIPCVTCVIIDARADEPMLVLSAACGFSVKETILKSGYEALNVLQSDSRRKDFRLSENYEPFIDASLGQRERIAAWKGRVMLERFNFFLEGPRQSAEDFLAGFPDKHSSTDRLEFVVKRLRELGPGYEVYLYEAKAPVLKKLGYHVVQTIVPQLIPMYLNEHLATLDSKRLREVPAKLGYKAATTLNPWPHPFP